MISHGKNRHGLVIQIPIRKTGSAQEMLERLGRSQRSRHSVGAKLAHDLRAIEHLKIKLLGERGQRRPQSFGRNVVVLRIAAVELSAAARPTMEIQITVATTVIRISTHPLVSLFMPIARRPDGFLGDVERCRERNGYACGEIFPWPQELRPLTYARCGLPRPSRSPRYPAEFAKTGPKTRDRSRRHTADVKIIERSVIYHQLAPVIAIKIIDDVTQ